MKKIIIAFLFLTSVSFAWTFNKNQGGGLTGYSTPINQDVYKQLGIDPNDAKQRLKSPTVMTDLFSAPKTNYGYNSSNVLKSSGGDGVGGKTGVTIIYD
ncbi:hypothetical protein IJ531_00520 [bacterium]|nr:hypothetical protein [bacterium]